MHNNYDEDRDLQAMLNKANDQGERYLRKAELSEKCAFSLARDEPSGTIIPAWTASASLMIMKEGARKRKSCIKCSFRAFGCIILYSNRSFPKPEATLVCRDTFLAVKLRMISEPTS